MPAPRVFVSSTFYDLKYIRENLKHFINSLGYEPILSEEGSIYYDPEKHVQEAAVADVPSCQMFVLIIGGRFGSGFNDSEDSVTNREYKMAVEAKVPIFALVERDVYEQSHVYRSNRDNEAIDRAGISYPAVDTPKVFDFIEEVQGQAFNNALVPFSNFGDVQNYLEQQWASMMFNFLTSRSEAERVTDTLEAVTEIGEKVEFLSRQILSKVGDDVSGVAVSLYDLLGERRFRHLLSTLDYFVKPIPAVFLKFKTFGELLAATGGRFLERDDGTRANALSWADGKEMQSMADVDDLLTQYGNLRESALKILNAAGVTASDYTAADLNAVDRAIDSRRWPEEASRASP